jgi:hypothetical protein
VAQQQASPWTVEKVRSGFAQHLEAALAKRRSVRQLESALAKVLVRRDVERLTQEINYSIEHPDWGQKVLDDDDEIRRNEAALKAALRVVDAALDDIRQTIGRHSRENETLAELEARPPPLWGELLYARLLGQRVRELETASRVLERLLAVGLISYPGRVGAKLKGWMVIADKLADESLNVVRSLSRRAGRRLPRGYGRAKGGPIIPFVHETLAKILPGVSLPSPERLRHILEGMRLDRVRRTERARREGVPVFERP